MKNKITPDTNQRFYEVAHEFGLIVDNQSLVNRKDRRSDEYKICVNMKINEEKMKLKEENK